MFRRSITPIAIFILATFCAETAVADDKIEKVLLDVDTNEWVPTWFARSADYGPGSALRSEPAWSIEKVTLRGGRQAGVDRIRVDNGVLSFHVLPTRGMNIWDAHCGDLRLGWDSPVKEIVHPQFIELNDRGGLGWLEGFGEWMNRCGLASNGAPGIDEVPSNTGAIVPVNLTLHGKVSYIPARRAEVVVEPGEKRPLIRVRGEVDEAALFGTQLRLLSEVRTEVGSKTMVLDDTVKNLASTPQEFQLLYHVNFGTPLLQDGAEFIAPLKRVAPRDPRAAEGGMVGWNRYGPPTNGYIEQVYFCEALADANGMTEVLLRNKAGDRGVSMTYSVKALPCLTMWKNIQSIENGYVTGIEPATNYPNLRSFERKQGRVPVLQGGKTFDAEVAMHVLTTKAEVDAALQRIQKLQGSHQTNVEKQPASDLSP